MATSLSSKRGYAMPSGNIGDKRLADITAIKSAITSIDLDIDKCALLNLMQITVRSDRTCVLADAGKHIYHPTDDTAARVITIPSNSSVPYEIGTVLTFVNDDLAGALSITINTDTMRLAGSGVTGIRTLTSNGLATAIKITATSWLISGTNLT